MPGDGKTAGRSISTPAPVRAAEACRHRRVQLEEMPRSAFDTEIGLTYTELTTDGVKAHLEVEPHLHQPMGIVHGGVWCAVVESLASVSAHLWLSENGGGNVVGVNNSTDFLRAVSEGKVFGVSEPIHRGRLQQLWLVTIRDSAQRLIARGQVRLQNLAER